MNPGLGIGLILGGAALAATAVLAGRRHIGPAGLAALAVAGACVGAGALLVQDRDVNTVNWAVTLLLSSIFAPVHAWLVLGPPRAGASS